MRTVHETEALRPSDPVPKHHSSNPSNKFQRLRLVLNERQKAEKGSTPASPSQPPHSAGLPPTAVTPQPSVHMGSTGTMSADTEYAHNNITYMDPCSPSGRIDVLFPPDIDFDDHELALPAPELFKLLRRQLHWALQDGEALRHEAEALEKQRKEEWVAKELVVENVMEAELAATRRRRIEAGLLDEPDSFKLLEADVLPSKKLTIEPKMGKLPWWREEAWAIRQAEARSVREGAVEGIREGMVEREMPREDDLRPGLRQEDMRQEEVQDIPMPEFKPEFRPEAHMMSEA
jgi:hypothetical protein